MKSKTTVALSLLTLAFACIAGYFAVENNQLREALADVQATQMAIGAEEETGLATEIEDSTEENGREEVVETAAEAKPTEVSERAESWQQRRLQARQERSRQFLDMLQDPERRLDFIERRMGGLDQRYADFFATLNLSGEQIEVLKTLMAERGVVETEARMKLFMAESDEEQKEAIREEMRLQQELLDGDIAALLGEEQVASLERYNTTLPYRNSVQEFARSLSYTDTPVSSEQSQALLDTYANLSEEFKFTENLGNGEYFRRGTMSTESVQTYIDEKEVFDTMVLEQASVYLEEAQLASLAEKQIAQRDRVAQHMEFMLQRNTGGGRGGSGVSRSVRLPRD